MTCDISGYADEAIGTAEHWGQLWASNGTTVVIPAVAGENFYAFGFVLPVGTQQIVAAICDLAGRLPPHRPVRKMDGPHAYECRS